MRGKQNWQLYGCSLRIIQSKAVSKDTMSDLMCMLDKITICSLCGTTDYEAESQDSNLNFK
jgi:hypothetical protein